ncbi:ATP-binding protein [Spirochaeta lutea]|nr:ATP-binding protein [Spirochaeta lutea]
MKDILYQYNPWWEEDFALKDIFPREKYINLLTENLGNDNVLFLTGLRRVGKTTLMKILIKKLIDAGIESKFILYVSVDDYLLKNKNLLEIIEEYKKIHRLTFDHKLYVFFDEITYQKDYFHQLKTLYDKYSIKIVATSSSSSLLKDKKAFLTGRSITIEVKPLDFPEYMVFKDINLKKRDSALEEEYFKDYIRDGGLPENVLNPNREYLMNLVDDIIQKDITAFHGIKNHQIMRDYFTLLMERGGKQLSINKIANILHISPDTSRRYLYYFEETFLIHLLPRWGKTNEKILSSKKIYACDLGIKYLFTGDRDLRSYFENYIYLQLRNKKEVFYLYEDGNEIDFITSDTILIEAKYNAEISGKQKALFDRMNAKKKLVINSVDGLKLLAGL